MSPVRLPLTRAKCSGLQRKVFVARSKNIPRMAADLHRHAAVENGIENLRTKLVVDFARELERVQPVLGQPIDDLVIELIAARPATVQTPR